MLKSTVISLEEGTFGKADERSALNVLQKLFNSIVLEGTTFAVQLCFLMSENGHCLRHHTPESATRPVRFLVRKDERASEQRHSFRLRPKFVRFPHPKRDLLCTIKRINSG
ncbi:hypothetical protein EVAR_94098_1 [Eumeta japonica]|uniref:Uncharacterized protein n=1 Tax=Eumeta variegata TaxID=151549 RepID=A0A4C1V5H8_EUMVA|nr:hypothetical protein EVAR_94098_1 [Eumeta japonica]